MTSNTMTSNTIVGNLPHEESFSREKPVPNPDYINNKKIAPTYKPGSVVDSHSSRPYITAWLKQSTRVQREQRPPVTG